MNSLKSNKLVLQLRRTETRIVEIEKFIQLTFDTDRQRNEKSETGRIDRAKTLVMQCRCTKKEEILSCLIIKFNSLKAAARVCKTRKANEMCAKISSQPSILRRNLPSHIQPHT